MAKIANVALTDTFNTWRTRTNSVLDRVSQFAINNSSLYANTLTANVSFTSKGLATLQGRATVGTNLTVSGNTTLGAAGKTMTTTGAWSHTGTQSISTNLTVTGNTTFGGASKTTTIGGATSTLTIGGTGSTANVTGWLGVAGRATVSTNLFVGGNTTIGGALTASKSAAQIVVAESTAASSGIQRKAATGFNAYDFYTINGVEVAKITANTSGWGVQILGADRFNIASSGLVTTNRSLAVTQNLTVSGNTTLNGTVSTAGANILQQTLADGATVNWNVALGQIATVTLGGNRTMAAPTNLKVGTYILHVYQDGTGSRTLTWNSVFKWTAAVAPPLTSAINSHDVFSFVSDGTNLYGSFMPDVR